jgi:hypothetical protein
LVSLLDPTIDGNGDVLVAVNVFDTCGMIECHYAWLYKLSRQSGAVLWRKRQPDRIRSLEVVDNDVIRYGLGDVPASTLARLSGTDGTEVWTSDLFPGDLNSTFDLYRVDDRHAIFTSDLENAKIDLRTGQAVWRVANSPLACVQLCQTLARLVLPNGNALTLHNESAEAVVRVYHNDGSGVVDKWTLSAEGPRLGTFVNSPILSPSGEVVLGVRRTLRGTPVGVNFLSRFNPDTGTLSAQQAIAARPFDPGSASRGWGLMAALDEHSVLVRGDVYESSLPVTTGVALLDTHVLAHGDLSASISIDADTQAGGQWVGFRMTVNYSGDKPITSVSLRGHLPWQGGTRMLQCIARDAGNCVVDTRFNSVNASFDIQPGGSISVVGELRRVDGEGLPPYFGVGTFGPIGLGETDTANNFARQLFGENP